MKTPKYIKDMDHFEVFGYEMDTKTLLPIRKTVVLTPGKDHGADPIGNGMFRMVPSGDVVDLAERNRRLAK